MSDMQWAAVITCCALIMVAPQYSCRWTKSRSPAIGGYSFTPVSIPPTILGIYKQFVLQFQTTHSAIKVSELSILCNILLKKWEKRTLRQPHWQFVPLDWPVVNFVNNDIMNSVMDIHTKLNEINIVSQWLGQSFRWCIILYTCLSYCWAAFLLNFDNSFCSKLY